MARAWLIIKFRKPCREECKRHAENVATTNMREARADVIGAQWRYDVHSEGVVLNLTIFGNPIQSEDTHILGGGACYGFL